MNADDQEFEEIALKLLFKRIAEDRFKVAQHHAPRLSAAIDAVKFDDNGEPILETANADVRRVACFIANRELEALEKTQMNNPVQDVMPQRVEVTLEQLATLDTRGKFTALTFDLFKEAGCLVVVAANVFEAKERTEHPFERSQAICAGHLVRIFKLIICICRLASTGDGAEVNLQLLRSVFETATNLRFLLLKDDPDLFEKFVTKCLGPERELYDLVQSNISARGGKVLSIEQRILERIDETCRNSGVAIGNVPKGHQEWSVKLWKKLVELGIGERNAVTQRIPSHSVHGDWVDLITFHLKVKDGKYGIQPKFWPNTPAVYLPASMFVLEAAKDYLKHFFAKYAEVDLVLERIDNLHGRLKMLDHAYETWVQKNPATEDYPS